MFFEGRAMQRFRFNISSLLLVVLFVGVGFAALRESSDQWESGIFTLAIVALLISILFAVHRTESRQAFWLGFAVFGWIYLALSLVPSIESRLITTKALACLDYKILSSPVLLTGKVWGDANNNVTGQALGDLQIGQKGQTVAVPSRPYTIRNETLTMYYRRLLKRGSGSTENFIRIGNSILTLFVAWSGGQLSRYLYPKNRHVTSELVPV